MHAILESGSAAAGVAERLNNAAGLLDDFEQNLTIFDIKLRHMREDIAAIEARNNSLELQARNNGKLLAKLQSTPRIQHSFQAPSALARLESKDQKCSSLWPLHLTPAVRSSSAVAPLPRFAGTAGAGTAD